VKTGIRNSMSELIVITYEDGTHPNHHLRQLTSEDEHADMVVKLRVADDADQARSPRSTNPLRLMPSESLGRPHPM
jgi:hypothetical protein